MPGGCGARHVRFVDRPPDTLSEPGSEPGEALPGGDHVPGERRFGGVTAEVLYGVDERMSGPSSMIPIN